MALSKELQAYIDAHTQWSPGEHKERIRFLAFALAGEAGEMTGPIKKNWRGDKKWTYDAMVAKLKEELPDIGNYLYMLCKELGLDLEELMLAKMQVVEQRPEYIEAHKPACTCGHIAIQHRGPNSACDVCGCMYYERGKP